VGWRKASILRVLLTNRPILIWVDRRFNRRAVIICIVVFEEIVESLGLFADKEDEVKVDGTNQERLHHVPG